MAVAAHRRLLSPAAIPPLVALTVVAYAIHTAAWISHQVQGTGMWPRWLELIYITGLVVWVTGFTVTLWVRSRLRRALIQPVLGDERTSAVFLRAHQAALVVVLLAQVPFFVISVPAQALAQLTVTTAIVALFAAYAWLDR
jgi:hypothetical protein